MSTERRIERPQKGLEMEEVVDDRQCSCITRLTRVDPDGGVTYLDRVSEGPGVGVRSLSWWLSGRRDCTAGIALKKHKYPAFFQWLVVQMGLEFFFKQSPDTGIPVSVFFSSFLSLLDGRGLCGAGRGVHGGGWGWGWGRGRGRGY